MSGFDSDSQPELRSPLVPDVAQLVEPLLRGEREPHGPQLMMLERQRIVEEDHEAVSRELLERAFVDGDQLAERPVVLAKHVEQLFGRSGLGERGEAAEIAEQTRDVRPVPDEESLTVRARDEIRHLRRDETAEFRPLPLNRVEQTGGGCLRAERGPRWEPF